LYIAALDARDPDELLQILQDLNRVLKHEKQVRHDFRRGTNTVGPLRGHPRTSAYPDVGIPSNPVPNKSEIASLAVTNYATDRSPRTSNTAKGSNEVAGRFVTFCGCIGDALVDLDFEDFQ
jgi:hypothetical protein